ncbi:MAG: Unknown protein [uncultured Aureispira sp.]|uniref:Uncharacterized protein n=1 Tax=uncultured Aureispira sp. TaxID=1331704 RepID=A0A6S6UJX6_9BACT|nr:MAG: Unknown protein [uncultured Aureispira sp.]
MEPFATDALVLGKILLSSIKGLPSFSQKKILKILEKEGLKQLGLDTWYPLKSSLACYAQIAEDFGPNTIFDLGKSVPEHAQFPLDIDSIENALDSIDATYKLSHKGGYIGFYKMISHDVEGKKIIMQCYNPYPCDFDRGLLTAMARKFQSGVKVVVDETKPTKKKGGDESWYIVSYR